jgi:hypothetical protein
MHPLATDERATYDVNSFSQSTSEQKSRTNRCGGFTLIELLTLRGWILYCGTDSNFNKGKPDA